MIAEEPGKDPQRPLLFPFINVLVSKILKRGSRDLAFLEAFQAVSKLFQYYFVVQAMILKLNCSWLLKNANKSHVQASNITFFSESAKCWKDIHFKVTFYYNSKI